MQPKPFWGDALTGVSPTARGELHVVGEEQERSRRVRAPLMLMLLLALGLAFGFVPALEDRAPQRGSFVLPPASRPEAQRTSKAARKQERRTSAVAAPAVEGKSTAATQQPQAAPETSAPAEPSPGPPPVEPTLIPQLPAVPELVEDVKVLLSGLPAPVGSAAG